MVCVPCFIVPVLLFLWHKFIQPYVLRFWNPWAVRDAEGNVHTPCPISCVGNVCTVRKRGVAVEGSDKEELVSKQMHENTAVSG